MEKVARQARDQLHERWPFEERFAIPFPARLFRTGDLVIEVPYLSGKSIANLMWGEWDVEKRPEINFGRRGGFDLGARRLILHITQVDGTPSSELQEAEFLRFGGPPSASFGYVFYLTRFYMAMCNARCKATSKYAGRPQEIGIRLKEGGSIGEGWASFSATRNANGLMEFHGTLRSHDHV